MRPIDHVRIAAEAIVDPRTVRRMYAGAPTTTTTRERVRIAAERLGLPPPPPAAEPPASPAEREP